MCFTLVNGCIPQKRWHSCCDRARLRRYFRSAILGSKYLNSKAKTNRIYWDRAGAYLARNKFVSLLLGLSIIPYSHQCKIFETQFLFPFRIDATLPKIIREVKRRVRRLIAQGSTIFLFHKRTARMVCFSLESLFFEKALRAIVIPASVNFWALRCRFITFFTSGIVPRYRRSIWKPSGVNFETTVPIKAWFPFVASEFDAKQCCWYSISV